MPSGGVVVHFGPCNARLAGLLPEGHGLSGSNGRRGESSHDRLVFGGLWLLVLGLVLSAQRNLALGGRLSVEEAALLDGAAGLDARDGPAVSVSGGAAAAVGGRGEVRDVFGDGVLRADGTGIDAVALAGLGHGIVARVEVFAVLEMLGEVVGSGGQLAVEAEEALLIRGERLRRSIWQVSKSGLEESMQLPLLSVVCLGSRGTQRGGKKLNK
ncbi:hypothetical protein Trco_000867 [Trichoderma cornu-damae]|uniref:Uncharacterized protein n=1 Tax=Trichoderma cornu-damae TaxID=654480 RepID=A0A9P8QXX5_9HYPO|nr:hypothetical protein Trco_000867 [Trichoderma cornu-damae]